MIAVTYHGIFQRHYRVFPDVSAALTWLRSIGHERDAVIFDEDTRHTIKATGYLMHQVAQ